KMYSYAKTTIKQMKSLHKRKKQNV
ncbi:hypothetical protein A5887_000241, partial [Enterococcus faecium]